MKNKHYEIDKQKYDILNGYISWDQIEGFNVKPLNNVLYEGVKVSHLKVVEPELIKSVLKRKIKIKLNTYLNILISFTEEDDDDSETYELILNDVELYKNKIINKYAKFLDRRYVKSLLKKVNMVERELKNKLQTLNKEKEVKIGKSR